jgi:hypothetical protein
MLLITVIAVAWGLGLGPLSLPARGEANHAKAVEACHAEIRDRLPLTDIVRFHDEITTRDNRDGTQVLSSFEGPRGRTHFSCEARLTRGVWQVTELLALN